MPKVVIDGVEYIPKAEIKDLTDENLQRCLEVLTSMRYFHQDHKMMGNVWEAINALSPELGKLEPNEAYDRIHGTESI
jgi:hypothetical protein